MGKLLEFKIETISKYRSALMGFAMIWVVLYHYHITGGLGYLIGNGFTGVDIFLFTSGFGLYYSMRKSDDIIKFWKRRAVRIFPTYIIIGLAITLLVAEHFSFIDFAWNYSTLAFWTNRQSGWFIPSIIFLYFLFPFLYYTIFKSGHLRTLVPLLFLLFFFIFYNCYIDVTIMDVNHFLLLYRIPIFLLGAFLAHLNYAPNLQMVPARYLSGIRLVTIFVLLITFFLIIHFDRLHDETIRPRYLSTTFLVPIIVYVLLLVLERTKLLTKVFGIIGEASFEIFLIHMSLLRFIENYYPLGNLTKVILCVICVFFCIYLHKILSILTKKLESYVL